MYSNASNCFLKYFVVIYFHLEGIMHQNAEDIHMEAREPTDIEATALTLGQTFPLGSWMRITVILNYHPKTAPPNVSGTRIILWLATGERLVCRYWDAFVIDHGERLEPIPHFHPTAHRGETRLQITRMADDPVTTSLEMVLEHFCKTGNVAEAVPKDRGLMHIKRDANREALRRIADFIRAGVALNPELIDGGKAELAKAA